MIYDNFIKSFISTRILFIIKCKQEFNLVIHLYILVCYFFLGIYYSNYTVLFSTCHNDKGNCLDKLYFYNYLVVK